MSSSHSAGGGAPRVRRFSPLTVLLAVASLIAASLIVWTKTNEVLALAPSHAPAPGSGMTPERLEARKAQTEAMRQNLLQVPMVVTRALEGSAAKPAAARLSAAYPENTAFILDQTAKNAAPDEEIRPLVKTAVDQLFGGAPEALKLPATPDSAKADAASAALAAAPVVESMRSGAQIYARYCVNCHGESGAGDGPSARHFVPEPRDFTAGVFKFTSTPAQAKPTIEDLAGSIAYGFRDHNAQVSMPSFRTLLSPQEIRDVANYVMYLSIRGETERKLLQMAASPEDPEAATLADKLGADPNATAAGILANWAADQKRIDEPGRRAPATAKSVARGRQLFLTSAKCLDCHGLEGSGNGKSFIDRGIYDHYVALQRDERSLDAIASEQPAVKARYEALTKGVAVDKMTDRARDQYLLEAVKSVHLNQAIEARHKELAASGAAVPMLDPYRTKAVADWTDNLDGWGGPFRPANLTWGYYRGAHVSGLSEADRDVIAASIYRRIKHGVNNAKMPAHYPTLLKTDDEIWDVVNYVMALPYQPELTQARSVVERSKREAGAVSMSTVTIFMGLAAVVGLVWAALRDLSERVQETAGSILDVDIDEPVGRATDALSA